MFAAVVALLIFGAQSLSLEKPRSPQEAHPPEYYYGTPFRISKDPNFEPFPNLTHCPPGSITAFGHSDGFGAVFTAFLTVYNYARTHKRTFCSYQFMDKLDHGGNGGELFNFIGGRLYGPKPKGNAYVINQKCNQRLAPQVREEVRYFYWHAPDPKPELIHFKGESPSALKVAWHVRHGDILNICERNCEWRLLNDDQLMHGLSALQQRYGSKLQNIHLFSDGKPEEFKKVLKFCGSLGLGCKLHTGESGDVMSDFHHMVSADVLVMARSTLSGMAAVINDKDVLDAHELAEEPLAGQQLVQRAKALSDDEKAERLLQVQVHKVKNEGRGVPAQLIGPVGSICPDDPGGGPIIKPH